MAKKKDVFLSKEKSRPNSPLRKATSIGPSPSLFDRGVDALTKVLPLKKVYINKERQIEKMNDEMPLKMRNFMPKKETKGLEPSWLRRKKNAK